LDIASSVAGTGLNTCAQQGFGFGKLICRLHCAWFVGSYMLHDAFHRCGAGVSTFAHDCAG